jgi:hypothetical protein
MELGYEESEILLKKKRKMGLDKIVYKIKKNDYRIQSLNYLMTLK